MAGTGIASQGAADPSPVRAPSPIPALGPVSYLPDAGWIITRHSQLRAMLADPGYEVPAVTAGGPAGTIGWLRASACRFANGDDHARRRALVTRELERMPPQALRADAERRAHA